MNEALEHPLAAWSILVASLLLTLCAWWFSGRMYQSRLQDRFAFRVLGVTDSIKERMLEYEQVLRGGVGLHAASESVSRDEWKKYVQNCELEKYFPGIQGVGVAVPVTADELSSHEAVVKAEGFADYKIRPSYERDFYTSIMYLEPFDWRNQRAFGYDMYSNSVRREAMDRAIETGKPAMSGKVTLVQETETDIQSGWLYYLPIFKNRDQSSSSDELEYQREDLDRFVYAAFRAKDLMSGILDPEDDEVGFEIYDCEIPKRNSLLFDSDDVCHLDQPRDSLFSKDVSLVIRGRKWTLHFESREGLCESVGINHSSSVAAGGLAVDVLLFLVIASIGRQKRIAEELADSMVKDVKENAELIRQILSNASEAIVTLDENGHVKVANKSAKQMFGFDESCETFCLENLFVNRTWRDVVEQLEESLDGHYKFAANLRRPSGEQFFCSLNFGIFTADNQKYYVLVAGDETDRVESDRKIQEINNELLKASKTAAKVEFANGVLHNVGNVLNSITVSTSIVRKSVEQSSLQNLERLTKLVNEAESDFVGFVQQDDRGKKLPDFLQKVTNALVEERSEFESELRDLQKNVSHVKQVIAAQQSDAKAGAGSEPLLPVELLEQALVVNKSLIVNNGIGVAQHVDKFLPEVCSDKHKILQILVNLVKNACDAIVSNNTTDPEITTAVRLAGESIQIEVSDNGIGMPSEVLGQIFQHGFTTKPTGHGYGLHSCIRMAADLGGSLTAQSEGAGQGAAFTLSIPVIDRSTIPKPDDESEHSSQFREHSQEVLP